MIFVCIEKYFCGKSFLYKSRNIPLCLRSFTLRLIRSLFGCCVADWLRWITGRQTKKIPACTTQTTDFSAPQEQLTAGPSLPMPTFTRCLFYKQPVALDATQEPVTSVTVKCTIIKVTFQQVSDFTAQHTFTISHFNVVTASSALQITRLFARKQEEEPRSAWRSDNLTQHCRLVAKVRSSP